MLTFGGLDEMIRQMIAGNWKMNGTKAGIVDFADACSRVPLSADLLVCPPFPLIGPLAGALAGTRVMIGAQDCGVQRQGAHTGDVSADLLREIGASHVILGHSERRADHHETSQEVRAKVTAAMAASLVPIVCVGEREAERDSGHAETAVCSQLIDSLPEVFDGLVAYEPVWAIGTGRTASPTDIEAMHCAVRNALVVRLGSSGAKIRILYGGSVKPDNAAELLAVPQVGGALVGGASLKAADFLAIAACAREA